MAVCAHLVKTSLVPEPSSVISTAVGRQKPWWHWQHFVLWNRIWTTSCDNAARAKNSSSGVLQPMLFWLRNLTSVRVRLSWSTMPIFERRSETKCASIGAAQHIRRSCGATPPHKAGLNWADGTELATMEMKLNCGEQKSEKAKEVG